MKKVAIGLALFDTLWLVALSAGLIAGKGFLSNFPLVVGGFFFVEPIVAAGIAVYCCLLRRGQSWRMTVFVSALGLLPLTLLGGFVWLLRRS